MKNYATVHLSNSYNFENGFNMNIMTSIEFNNQLLSNMINIRRFAHYLTTDDEQAEGLVQDTCLKALRYKERYVEVSTFNSWLLTILKNTFINNYRRSVREKSFFIRAKDENISLYVAEESDFGMPDSEINCIEINKYIESLRDDNRIPFQMFISGFKYKEIASTLNVNIGTVKSRIFLARKKLKRSLTGFKRNSIGFQNINTFAGD